MRDQVCNTRTLDFRNAHKMITGLEDMQLQHFLHQYMPDIMDASYRR